jgi:hypothetical protein
MLVSIAYRFRQNKSLPAGLLGSYAYQHGVSKGVDVIHSPTCPSTIPLYRPWSDKLLLAAVDAFNELGVRWRARAERRRREQALDAVADMNELLLRDIGAPEWMIAQANVRREVERQRLLEVQHGPRVGY